MRRSQPGFTVSPLLLTAVKFALAASIALCALLLSDAELRRVLVGSFGTALALLLGGQALMQHRRRRRQQERSGLGLLPDWAASLPEEKYVELETRMRDLERRAVRAEQAAESARRRAGQAFTGMWDVLSSAVHSEERIRGRFVSDLHDSVVQTIIVCAYLSEDEDTPREQLSEHLRDAERQLRDIMVLTRPPELQSGDLGRAISALTAQLGARMGLQVSWEWPEGDRELPHAFALTLYRFFQESLNNVAKHAGTDHAEAGLTLGAEVVAWVADSGRGFDAAARSSSVSDQHVGLSLLSDRASQIGASIDVRSSPGEGTRVTLTLPVPPAGVDRPVPLGQVHSYE